MMGIQETDGTNHTFFGSFFKEINVSVLILNIYFKLGFEEGEVSGEGVSPPYEQVAPEAFCQVFSSLGLSNHFQFSGRSQEIISSSAFLCFPHHIPDNLAVNMTINLFLYQNCLYYSLLFNSF